MDEELIGPQTLVGKVTSASNRLYGKLSRTKKIDLHVLDTSLRRCLSTADVTLLGIGHMVGSGVYVLSATVAKNMAGPAIVLAFLLSGFASFLSALCYAELGVRYPRSGSAYSYTYLALGELWAFLVGWNVILENVIGVAAVGRACSAYIDSLAGGVIKNATESLVGPFRAGFFEVDLDFLALGIVIAFVIFLSFGVKLTSQLNNVCSFVNLGVIMIIIGVGAYFSDFSNWTNPATGGFMPYGWSGVLSASASCFFAYIGFDAVATSGEEAKDPQKSIPIATMVSMGTASLAYVGVSSVLTMMVSYKSIADDAGLPEALAMHGANWAKVVVIMGAVCGMATALIGCLFALTRVVYAMADDGLLFGFFAVVNDTTKIPLTAMYTFSGLSAILALTLDIQTLVEVMSIGTLFAYMVVGASVIILRYRPTGRLIGNSQELSPIGNQDSSGDNSPNDPEDLAGQFRQRFYAVGSLIKCEPGRLISYCVFIMTICLLMICIVVRFAALSLQERSWWTISILVVLCIGFAVPFVLILMHQQSPKPLRYKVPFVPLLPIISIAVNTLLITSLREATWIRLVVWVFIGLILYFFYGIKHSKLNEVVVSPKSSLIGVGSPQVATWGTYQKEPAIPPLDDKSYVEKCKLAASLSQEALTSSMEKEP